MGHLKNWWRRLRPNPLSQKLRCLREDARILFFWNRGLGDIPLELFALKKKLLEKCPRATLEVVTREDLKEGFLLLGQLKIYTTPLLVRNTPVPLAEVYRQLSIHPTDYDLILTSPDPTYWLKEQKGHLIPKLQWSSAFEKLIPLTAPTNLFAFLHLDSETVYGFEKNLPESTWNRLLAYLNNKGYTTVALGAKKDHRFTECAIDLRGKTTLFEFISLMLNSKGIFIGPDSGLLNMLYFLDVEHPLYLISYWANTHVGLFKQNVASPNPHLTHHPILAPIGQLNQLQLEDFSTWIP